MATLETLNRALFLRMNADLSTPHWQLELATVAAEYFIFLVPVFLICMWCWGSKAQRGLALRACVVALTALAINQLLGAGWPHPRPSAIGLGHTFIVHATDSSFPSEHATIFLAMGLTFLFANARSSAAWATLFVGLCVAWARIFVGVHYPFDMVGATAVVSAVWLFIRPIWSRVGEPVTALGSNLYRAVFARPIALGWIRR